MSLSGPVLSVATEKSECMSENVEQAPHGKISGQKAKHVKGLKAALLSPESVRRSPRFKVSPN